MKRSLLAPMTSISGEETNQKSIQQGKGAVGNRADVAQSTLRRTPQIHLECGIPSTVGDPRGPLDLEVITQQKTCCDQPDESRKAR